MGRTPDRHPGEDTLVDVGAIFTEQSVDPPDVGTIRYVSGALKGRDATGVFNLRTGGGGITEAQHEVIDSLVHELAETSYLEVTRSAGQVTDVIVWETAAKLKKIRETNVTRTAGQASVVVEKQYDGAGVLKQTLTHTITRSSGQVASIATVEVP
jgi:hypothetical protein